MPGHPGVYLEMSGGGTRYESAGELLHPAAVSYGEVGGGHNQMVLGSSNYAQYHYKSAIRTLQGHDFDTILSSPYSSIIASDPNRYTLRIPVNSVTQRLAVRSVQFNTSAMLSCVIPSR